MNKQSIDAFAMRIGQDPELQRKVEALQEKPVTEIIRGLVDLSREAGTPVTAEVWAASFGFPSGKELKDDDLKTMSGGRGWMGFFQDLLQRPDSGQRT